MQIRVTVPKRDVNETTLGAAAEANAAVAQTQIESGRVPLAVDAIRAGLVRWKPEDNAPGQESFDPPTVALERGNADCDDLAPWHAASLRATGEDPEAYPIAYQSGPTRWHVVVQRSDGSIDDPSRWAGMGRVEGNRPAATPAMTSKRGATVGFTRKPSGIWVARLDAPIEGEVCGVAVERAAYDQFTALHRLCSALGVLAFWGLPDDVLERMAACARAIRGVPDDYAAYGEFVEGVAKQVAHMSVDPNAAANIATTVLDPFGLHNLIQPLASEFVSSYAQGLAHRGETSAPAVSGDGCPPGSHWELHAGSWVCVPDALVMGDDRVWVTLKATGEKIQVPKDQVASLKAADLIEGAGSRGGGSSRGGSSRGGGRGGDAGGRGGSRAQQGRQQRQQQQDGGGDYCDPATGLCFDSQSGLWYDPTTGIPVYGFDPSQYAQPQYQQQPAPQSFPQYGGQWGYGYGAYPGYGQQPFGAYQGYGAQPSYGMQDPTGYWAQLAAAEQGGGLFAPGAYQHPQPYAYGQQYGYGW